MIERRVLLATLLSIICITGYAQIITKVAPMGPHSSSAPPQEAFTANEPSSPSRTPALDHREDSVQLLLDRTEDPVLLESAELLVEVGDNTGAIRAVGLKTYQDASREGFLQMQGRFPLAMPTIDGVTQWRVERRSNSSVTLASVGGSDVAGYRAIYSLDEGAPIVRLSLKQVAAEKKIDFFVNMMASWKRSDEMDGRYNQLEAYVRTDKGKHKRYNAPIKKPINIPRRTAIGTLTDRYFCLSMRSDSLAETKMLTGESNSIALQSSYEVAAGENLELAFYFGPRDFFHLREAKFKEAIPVGIIGQIGLMLLLILKGISGITHNYGVAIVIFSVIISGAMAPFTLISLRSMKKMQELKPQMDEIMKKHKEDPSRANQEVFALYKQNRVSPLSGCLPMMLQMPIFFAMFQSISSFIDLRGEAFLWINDLSLPDHLAQMPFSLPFIGDYLNALPIIMAVAMYIQTLLSQSRMTAGADNPAAKIMSGPIMPLVFGVFCYNLPAGLVLYWLTNSVISAVVYRFAR